MSSTLYTSAGHLWDPDRQTVGGRNVNVAVQIGANLVETG
jgi:hypothetical protein